jgi:hypothetical protein
MFQETLRCLTSRHACAHRIINIKASKVLQITSFPVGYISTMALPAALSPALSDREGVADALYRFIVGLDTNDVALFESAFTRDGVFNINGRTFDGLDNIRTGCYEPVSKLDTTHFPSNIRINVTGSKATMSASALAQHYRGGTGRETGAPRYMTGGLYLLDLVKDDTEGLWKIKHFKAEPV